MKPCWFPGRIGVYLAGDMAVEVMAMLFPVFLKKTYMLLLIEKLFEICFRAAIYIVPSFSDIDIDTEISQKHLIILDFI